MMVALAFAGLMTGLGIGGCVFACRSLFLVGRTTAVLGGIGFAFGIGISVMRMTMIGGYLALEWMVNTFGVGIEKTMVMASEDLSFRDLLPWVGVAAANAAMMYFFSKRRSKHMERRSVS
jgi:hypothetical protein